MLDWIFEGIVTWISSVVSDMMDAVSGLFLQALGTDMTAMEEYFPFVSKAFTVMQYTAWALLFLITVWQLFRVFGGPVTEAENPWVLLGRSALFAFLIGYAKPIFLLTLKIATAPYTALMDIQMTAEDFTFAGIEQALQNGLTSLIATISVVGLLLLTILEIALGWNYFKLLLETVERYIVVGVLCYTSPLAFSMGASKATTPVFRSWCRTVRTPLSMPRTAVSGIRWPAAPEPEHFTMHPYSAAIPLRRRRSQLHSRMRTVQRSERSETVSLRHLRTAA